MKTFRSKGKNGGFNQKGSKYKKFLWMKNKNKNKATAKYGVGVRHDDDAPDAVNYNLMCDESEKPEEPEEEVVDEMSAEAVFARLKNQKTQKIKNPTKKILNLNRTKSNFNSFILIGFTTTFF